MRSLLESAVLLAATLISGLLLVAAAPQEATTRPTQATTRPTQATTRPTIITTTPVTPTSTTTTTEEPSGLPPTLSPELEQARDGIIAVLITITKENLDEIFKIFNTLREFRRHI